MHAIKKSFRFNSLCRTKVKLYESIVIISAYHIRAFVTSKRTAALAAASGRDSYRALALQTAEYAALKRCPPKRTSTLHSNAYLQLLEHSRTGYLHKDRHLIRIRIGALSA